MSYASVEARRAVAPVMPPHCQQHPVLTFGCASCHARARLYWRCGCGDYRNRQTKRHCLVCRRKAPAVRT